MPTLSWRPPIIVGLSLFVFACASTNKPVKIFVRGWDNTHEHKASDKEKCGYQTYKEANEQIFGCGVVNFPYGVGPACAAERKQALSDLINFQICMRGKGWEEIKMDRELYDSTYGKDPKDFSRPYQSGVKYPLDESCPSCFQIQSLCNSTTLTNDQKTKFKCVEKVPLCLDQCYEAKETAKENKGK